MGRVDTGDALAAAQMAAFLSWRRQVALEEEQRQVAAREATRLATDLNEKGRVGPLSDTALIAAANPVANGNPFSNTSPAANAPTPVTKRLVAVEEVVSEPRQAAIVEVASKNRQVALEEVDPVIESPSWRWLRSTVKSLSRGWTRPVALVELESEHRKVALGTASG